MAGSLDVKNLYYKYICILCMEDFKTVMHIGAINKEIGQSFLKYFVGYQ